MDIPEVNMCSRQEKRLGELSEYLGLSINFALSSQNDFLLFDFRLQEQPAERESPHELSA